MIIILEKYSFSKLSCFNQCKYQFFLKYIAKASKENNAFAEFGKFVHEILERYAKGELAVFELSDIYKDEFCLAISENFPYNKYTDLKEKYYIDGLNFFNSFSGLEDYEILGVEEKFKTNIDDEFLFIGIIDLILKDKAGNLIIRDWKSKNKFKSKKEMDEYAKQLYLYSIYVKEKYGKYPDKLEFGLFRSNEIQSIDFNKNDFDNANKWMIETVKEIEQCDRFEEYTDFYYCNNLCEFRNLCELKE